ncbi:MAG: nucleotidyltransferase family protein [Micropepsaceae bacterium]
MSDGHWTWPRGQLDLLLRAVLTPDADAALAAARQWLDRNEIDSASFREHRLLASLAQRFGTEIADHPAGPRLAGLARHLWARSQVAQREAAGALAALARDMPVMLIKGASRSAADPQASRGRIAHDIDILVRDGDMPAALASLLDRGWRHAGGASRLRLTAMLPESRAINLGSGALGDIDLHRDAYHAVNASAEDEAGIWARSQAVSYLGAAARIPHPSDRALLAIGHGALDAHKHSDWLVDCGFALSHAAFDWDVFLRSAAARRLDAQALIALGYLSGPVGLAVPREILAGLSRAARRRPFGRVMASLQAAPRENLSKPGHLMRGLAKLWRKGRDRRSGPAMAAPSIQASARRAADGMPDGAMLSTAIRAGSESHIRLRLRVAYPAARRAVFEINAADRHVATLVMRNRSRTAQVLEAGFLVPVPASLRGKPLVIEARPSRLVRESANLPFRAVNDALPFALVEFG